MAKRRMFANDVVDTDLFMEMPSGARLLYYDLGMRADDDGFVSSPKKIMKMTNASEDDFRILILRNFIISFDTGIIVIRHWKLNNYLRIDRYKETIYTKEKSQLVENINGIYTFGVPLVYQNDTNGTHSIGKVSIGKVSIDNYCLKSFNDFWNMYPKKMSKVNAKEWFIKNNPDEDTMSLILKSVEDHKKTIQWQDFKYIPYPFTFLISKCWEDELDKKSLYIENTPEWFNKDLKSTPISKDEKDELENIINNFKNN